MLDAGVKVDAPTAEQSPVYAAALNGHIPVVGLLARRGANLNRLTSDKDADTPLHIAAHNGHLGVCKAAV